MTIECEQGIVFELADTFTFMVPNYWHHPKFKLKLWDGKIRLFNRATRAIYLGLIPKIVDFCNDRNYTYELVDQSLYANSFSIQEGLTYVQSLNAPFKERDYQVIAFTKAIRDKRRLILSPTSSGKSFIIYCYHRFLQDQGLRGLLIAADRVSLIKQMIGDFEEYAEKSDYNPSASIHGLYEGSNPNVKKDLTITIYQTIQNYPAEWFHQFDYVMGDEAHLFKANSLKTIMENCINAEYRMGTTGTLDGTQTHQLVLEGLFGPCYRTIKTRELIDRKEASPVFIKSLILKHSEAVAKEARAAKNAKKWTYKKEVDFLVQNSQRNNFIKNLALSLKGNTLLVFQFIDKHGQVLYDLISKEAEKQGRSCYFIHGGVDIDERERVRKVINEEEDAILAASYGTFEKGINVPNLHNLIFAQGFKAQIRNLQTLGRMMRLGTETGGKTHATLFDIVDDMRIGSFVNYSINHYEERLAQYIQEQHPVTSYNIQL